MRIVRENDSYRIQTRRIRSDNRKLQQWYEVVDKEKGQIVYESPEYHGCNQYLIMREGEDNGKQ